MIAQIRMINCQSWEDGTFKLARDRLNVIIADNGTGKSVLMRMLKITACPKVFSRDEQPKLIRWGSPFARIAFGFYDGAIGITDVYPNSVIYRYKFPNTKEWVVTKTPLPEYLQNIGLVADAKNNFIANIIDMDQDLVLVAPKLKSNYDLMRMLVYCEDLENTKLKISDLRSKVSQQLITVNSTMFALQSSIQQCKYVELESKEYELRLDRYSFAALYNCIDVAEDTSKLLDVAKYNVDFKRLFNFLEALEFLESLTFSSVLQDAAPVSVGLLETLESLETFTFKQVLQDVEPVSIGLLEILESLETFTFNQVLQDAEPASIGLLEVLEALEGITLSQVLHGVGPVSVSLLEVLEMLEGITFDQVLQDAEPASTTLLEYLERLQSISFREVLRWSLLIDQDLKSIEECEHKFVESGEVLDCQVFGKVVYDGKECIPYSE